MSNYKIIRCPNNKPHGRFDTCGSFLGAIGDNSFVFYCGHCNILWQVSMDDNNVVCKKVPKGTKIEMSDPLRLVEDTI